MNKQWSAEVRAYREYLVRRWGEVPWTLDLDAPEEGVVVPERVRSVRFSTAKWAFTPAFRTAWTRLHPTGPGVVDGRMEFVLTRHTQCSGDAEDNRNTGPSFAFTDVPTFATPQSRREVLDKRYLFLLQEASDAAREQENWEGLVERLRWCVREEWIVAGFGGTTTVETFPGGVGLMMLMGDGAGEAG